MTHPMAQQLIDFLRDASSVDMGAAPAFVFMNKLRSNLVFCGLSAFDAETIATNIDVEIPVGALEDEDIDTLAVLYCKLIMNAHAAMVEAGYEHADAMVKNVSRQFTLKLS